MAQGGETFDTRQGEAAAALLALRGTVADQKLLHRQGYVLPPLEKQLSLDEAASQLALLPKPVMCSAIPDDGLLIVRCEELDTAAREIHTVTVPAFQEWVRSSLPEGARLAADPPILLRAGSRSLVLPLGVCLRFLNDYHIAFGSTIDPPDDEARDRGAVAVWQFEPGAQVEINEGGFRVKPRP